MSMQEWSLRDFSDGIIDAVDDTLLPVGAARDSQNFISRTVGTLEKRLGQVRLNPIAVLGGAIQGMYAYYFGEALATRRLLVGSNGTVAWWDFGTSSWTNLRTGQNAALPFMFETLVNDVVCFNGVNTPWRWNGTAVSDLVNAPVDGRFPVLHQEKLFVVPMSAPSTLRWSDSFQPTQWPAVNFWPVKQGDGDEITCLRSYMTQLLIFKQRSLHLLRGFSLEDFRLEELDGRVGCVGPFAAAQHGPQVYFVSHEGLCVFNGVRVINLTADTIPRLWRTINQTHLRQAVVTVRDNIVWVSVPEGASVTNNLVIAYRIPEGNRRGSFWVWRGIEASCFVVFGDGVQQRFFSGDARLGFVNEQQVGNTDFGNAINAFWLSKSYDQETPEREKLARKVFVEDSISTTNTVTVDVSCDYKPFITLSLIQESPTIRAFRLPLGTRWRYISARFTHNLPGACEVRGLLVPYKVKTKPRVRR